MVNKFTSMTASSLLKGTKRFEKYLPTESWGGDEDEDYMEFDSQKGIIMCQKNGNIWNCSNRNKQFTLPGSWKERKIMLFFMKKLNSPLKRIE